MDANTAGTQNSPTPRRMTYTERAIHLGQDINNAWALVAAEYQGSIHFYGEAQLERLRGHFQQLFTIVHEESEAARNKVLQEVSP